MANNESETCFVKKKNEIKKDGLDGGSNSRPLAPTASVLPLDQLLFLL